MKTILYLATSINGHITLGEDGTDWVSKETLNDFEKLNKECGVVVMGKRTFEMFGQDFPQKDCLNIVMTKDPELLKRNVDGALFSDEDPKGIVEIAQRKGYEKLFIVGGTKMNTSFLKDNLIDEIWLNIHPLVIGNGKYLFEEEAGIDLINLNLIKSTPFAGGQILVQYQVIK